MNILCFGDSNTWGYKPDKTGRFDENTRWTALLQKKLGPEYHIIEEGLCGRTTVFQDELREGRRGLDLIGVTVEMHNPIDLMIIMLGTNDLKNRFNVHPHDIASILDDSRIAVRAGGYAGGGPHRRRHQLADPVEGHYPQHDELLHHLHLPDPDQRLQAV